MKIEASIRMIDVNGKYQTHYAVLLIDGPREISIVQEMENDARYHVQQIIGMIDRARSIAALTNRDL